MLLPAVVLALLMLPAPGPTPTVATHDNRLPAGVTRDGTLRLDLEIVRGDWYPNGADRAGANVLVFAERGHGPTTPGPLVRARAGTSIAVSMHNTTDDTLAIHGLTSKIGLAAFDSVVVLPGASRSWTFIAETEGSYLYWGARPGTPLAEQLYDDAQLNGALIVDPATGAIPADRIMVIDSYTDGKLPNGDPDLDRELLVVNGRPWPDTERLQYAVGDSIRWRVLNASVAPHPMHLHGFYFRVDGRGDWRRDTLYSDAERRMAVTELLKPGQSMHLTWSPNRPGGWLFHCHLSYHVLPNPPLGAEFTNGDSLFAAAAFGENLSHAAHHTEQHMGGLMLVINVTGPWTPPPPPTHTIRLLVVADGDTTTATRHYGYVLGTGAPASAPGPAPTLVLQRGEPTGITVVNTTHEVTSVHWHGIEIDAYADGVVGVGGMPGMPIPPIMPGDSFVARFVPPRSGSFMYHTHVSDVNQQGKGLSGALLVVDDRSGYDPSHDRIFLAETDLEQPPMLNGQLDPAPDTVRAGETYRLRLMNITLGAPYLVFRFVTDSFPTAWKTIAKDGFDLPLRQRAELPAVRPVSIGETMDVTWTARPGGSGWLEMRSEYGLLFRRQRIVVVAGEALPKGGN